MSANKKIVLVGATSGIARQCARRWVESGPAQFVLVGRDATRLEEIAADLRTRGGETTRAEVLVGDFLDPAAVAQTVAASLRDGPPDIVLIAHGTLPDQLASQGQPAACAEILNINGLSPAIFAEAYADALARAGRGTLAIVGSVAGDRGRKTNYLYGAAKGLLERLAQGLQHRFAGSPVRVVLIKPGPTDTPMTAHLKATGARLASVDEVAATIVAGIARGQSVIYAPARWRVIMWVIRHLPAFVFNRLNI